MKLDDLKSDWQQTLQSADAPDNLTEVIAMLALKTEKIDKEIKRRDILEIGIALLLIPFWVYGLINTAGNMQTIGLVLAIFSSIFIPFKLIKAKQIKHSKASSLRAFLENERQKLYQQKRLLETVLWWYLTPITVSIVLIVLGSTVDEHGLPQLNDTLSLYFSSVAVLYAGIYFLNKRAAKKKFTPLLENVEQRLAQLES